MAITGNFRGTTQPRFQISKSGAKIFGTSNRPENLDGPDAPAEGDIWINQTSNTLEVYESGQWKNIGATLQELNVADGTLIVDAGNNEVRSTADLLVSGSVTANEFVGNINLESATTDTLAEGVINQYFTDERVLDALPVVEDVLYVNKNGKDTNDGRTEYTAFLTISEAFESIGEPYKPNFPAGADVIPGGKNDAAELMRLNKEFIQAEVIAYVDTTYPNLLSEVQRSKCKRDTGYIVENIIEDLQRGGSQFSEESGLAYFNGTARYIPTDQILPTTNAISVIATLASDILSQTTRQEGNYQSTVTQVTNGELTAEEGSLAHVSTLITGINTTITNPLISRGADLRGNFTLDAQLNPGGYANASVLLNLNKSFIQEEVITFVKNENGTDFLTQENFAKCKRDTGFIVDALVEDLDKGGFKQSSNAALSYYEGNVLDIPSDTLTPTTNAISYIKTLASDILTNTQIDPTLQGNVSQVIDASYTSDAQAITNLTLLVDGITATIESPNVHQQVRVTGNFPRDAGSNRGGFNNAAELLIRNRHLIQEEVIGFVDSTESFQYDEETCRRDTGYIIDALALDLVLNTNYNSVYAGIAYQRVSSKTVLTAQYNATVAAIGYIRDEINALGIDSTSQTFITARTADLLSVFQNNVIPDLFFNTPGGEVSQSEINAHNQLRNNRSLIQDAIITFIANNYTALEYDDIKCRRDVGFIVDGLSFDILYGGNRGSRFSADSYYSGAVNLLGTNSNEIFATIGAYTELKSIVSQVVQETYQGQDTTAGTASVSDAGVLESLIDIILNVIIAGNKDSLVEEILPDTSWASVGVSTDYASINTNKSTIQNDTITYINTNFTALLDNEAKLRCKRDVGHIVDALYYDLINGGYEESKKAAVYYYDGAVSVLPSDQVSPTTNAISHIATISNQIINNQTVTPSYQSAVTQYTDNTVISEAQAGTIISNLITGINATITTAYPRRVIIKVAAGDYTIDNPIKMPEYSAMFGEGLRTTSIRPYYTNQDMFYMNVGTYITGVTFRDHVAPSAATAFNPALKGTIRPDITTSPYVQNCTSRTTTGTGMRINGSHVRGNIRSMVVDSFTQFNEGGTGIHILDRGYAQLVSVFTINCNDGFLCESGGQTSITNSNSSFGTRALKSTGTSQLLYKGTIADDVVAGKNIVVNNMPARPRVGDAVKFNGISRYLSVDRVEPIDTYSCNITLIEAITSNTAVTAGTDVEFYQRSLIVASSHTMEYVGSGNDLASSLPANGGVPIPANEGVVDSDNAGKVFFTATNERGDFSVSGQFIINQNTGTVSGRTFNKSLFAVMTPYILALQD